MYIFFNSSQWLDDTRSSDCQSINTTHVKLFYIHNQECVISHCHQYTCFPLNNSRDELEHVIAFAFFIIISICVLFLYILYVLI